MPAGNGKKEIDVVGYLKDKTHPLAELMSCRRRLEFPSDEYPPNEESKDLIVRAILQLLPRLTFIWSFELPK